MSSSFLLGEMLRCSLQHLQYLLLRVYVCPPTPHPTPPKKKKKKKNKKKKKKQVLQSLYYI